jgi:probable rRNA maturation factor
MNGIDIEINQRTQIVQLGHQRCHRAVQLICEDSGHLQALLSIAVVDDRESRSLHRRYLQQDTPTDVLSFPLDRRPGTFHGEIIVNAEMAARQAPLHGWKPVDELLLYVVHGALHLVGYDDHSASDRERMFAKQRDIFARLGYDAAQLSKAVTTSSRHAI